MITDLISQGLTLINKLFPDKTQVEKDQLLKDLKLIEVSIEEKKIDQQIAQGQVDINKAEAASENLFKSGWRPFIGWVCGICLGMYYVPQFFLGTILWTRQCVITNQLVAYPIDADQLFQLLGAMLGIATLRSVDKIIPLFKKR